MSTSSANANALLRAVVEAGERPKDFLKRLKPPPQWNPHGGFERAVGEFSLESYGIEHCQYWQGVSTMHTQWDAVYVGTGDTPHEAGEEALSDAANDYDVQGIQNDLPDEPSVSDEIASQAKSEAESQVDRASFESDEDYEEAVAERAEEIMEEGEWELYNYAVLWIKQFQPGDAQESLTEADESPRDFFKKLRGDLPQHWPKINRWYKADFGQRRRAFVSTERHPQKKLRNTWFKKYPRPGEYGLQFHQTEVLYYDGQGNIIVTTGGWKTRITRKRINTFSPYGWKVALYQYGWYWFNQKWPQEINQEIYADIRARRRPTSKFWIPFNDGDKIDSAGTLHFHGGTATRDGEVTAQPVHEGRYLDRLAWAKRVQAKHKKMREVKKRLKGIEDLDKPDKKEEAQQRPRDFLKTVNKHGQLQVGESVSRATMRTSDLIEAFLTRLEQLDPGAYTLAKNEAEELEGGIDGEEAEYFLNEKLWGIMQQYCPPLTYFGAHPGDGSDIGCWPWASSDYEDFAQQGEIVYAEEGSPETQHVMAGLQNYPEHEGIDYGVVVRDNGTIVCHDKTGKIVWTY